MKTLGLVGGTSWVSTAHYYALLNELAHERLGGDHGARLVLYSFDHAEMVAYNQRRDWPGVLELVAGVCRHLVASGAEGVMLCANTMHVIADDLRAQLDVPVIHIAEVTAAAIERQGLARVGLLGTRFTMEMDFFKAKLAARGIETLVPEPPEREFVHETIFGELARNDFRDATRRRYLAIMEALAARGAQGVVLGCTEIPMLVRPADTALPLFDTVRLHAEAAVEFALG